MSKTRPMSDARSSAFAEDSIATGYERHLLNPLFEPWAAELLRRAGLGRGDAVLDAASGLGPVARQAATSVGPDGRVVACDISPAMSIRAGSPPLSPGPTRIVRMVCSADALARPPAPFDAVLCRQGLQFFSDRVGAVREMYRVARPGGTTVVASWAKERAFGLFGPLLEACRETGMAEPCPAAFDPDVRMLSRAEMAGVLRAGGWTEVMVETVERDATWPSMDAAVASMAGTPFGPHAAALRPQARARVAARFAAKLGVRDDGRVVVRTSANLGRAASRQRRSVSQQGSAVRARRRPARGGRGRTRRRSRGARRSGARCPRRPASST